VASSWLEADLQPYRAPVHAQAVVHDPAGGRPIETRHGLIPAIEEVAHAQRSEQPMPVALGAQRQVGERDAAEFTSCTREAGTEVLRLVAGTQRLSRQQEGEVELAEQVGRIDRIAPMHVARALPGQAGARTRPALPQVFDL